MDQDAHRRLVVFGAGSVGRGFVGELFSRAGWLVSFLDIDPRIVEPLRSEGHYEHRVVGRAEVCRQIGPVVAGYVSDRDHVRREIAVASVIATAVGATVLPRLCPVLQDGLLARFAAGGEPVDVLLCENLHGASRVVRELLRAGLSKADASLLDARVGLVETSIGRMIPVPDRSDRRPVTSVAAEPYSFLPVDPAAMRGPAFGVPEIVTDRSVDFEFYSRRKLQVHNMGHYLCGLLAQSAGYSLVWQGIADPGIRYFTRAAMVEACLALAADYDRPVAGLLEHVDDLVHRFGNRALGDTVERVVRDPGRKMASDDRVLGAFAAAVRAGTPTRHLSLAVAAGTSTLSRIESWPAARAHDYLRSILAPGGTPAEEARCELATAQLASLDRRGFDFAEQIGLIGDQFDLLRIV